MTPLITAVSCFRCSNIAAVVDRTGEGGSGRRDPITSPHSYTCGRH